MQKESTTRSLKEFFLKQMEADLNWRKEVPTHVFSDEEMSPPSEILLNVKVSVNKEQFNSLLQQDAIKKAKLSIHLSMDSVQAVEYPLSKSEWFLQQNQPVGSTISSIKAINFSSYQNSSNPFGLSPREIDIMKLLAQGLLYKEIACELGISIFTVKNHLKKIYPKLGASNRSEAILKYLKFSQ